MRKILTLIVLALLLCTTAFAEEDYGADALMDGLDAETQELLGDASPTQTADFTKTLYSIFSNAVTGAESSLREAVRTACVLLLTVMLCGFAENMNGRFSPRLCTMAGALGITAACTRDLTGMMGLAAETIERITAYCTLSLPVMASTAAASGALTSGTVLYTAANLFSDVLLQVMKRLLVPTVYAFAAVACAECACAQPKLGKLRELLGWVITNGMKLLMYGFTGFLTVSGIFSAGADEAAVKAAKSAVSVMLPVVGGIVSDAADSVLAGAKLLRSTVGVFGLLAALAVGLLPFFRIAAHYLALKLAAAVGGTVGSSELSSLLSSLASAMGFMLAMVGCAVLMAMVSFVCFMKVGSV